MSRIARVVLPDYPHRVTQRGVRSTRVFFSNRDRAEYLRLLSEQAPRHGLKVLSYCLMTNHIHLIVVPETAEGLARGIGETHKRYTRYVNFRQGVRGYLFQGRFFSCPLDGRHLVAAARYAERNPVRAGMVKRAWEYRWSSAAYDVGLVERDPLLTGRELYQLVGAKDWRMLLARAPEESAAVRRATCTGRPCGDKRFLRRAEKLTGRCLHPLKPGRPPKGKRRKK